MLARIIVKWLALLVALVAVAAIADAVTVKTGPGRSTGTGSFSTIRWNVTGTTDGGRVAGPSNLPASDTFVVGSDVRARTYAPAGTPYRIIRFAVTILSTTYTAANQHCTFSITKDGSTPEAWSSIVAGDVAGSIDCTHKFSIADSDIDNEEESCTQVSAAGTLVSPGEYWQILSDDRSGATDCESVTSLGFEVTLDLS